MKARPFLRVSADKINREHFEEVMAAAMAGALRE